MGLSSTRDRVTFVKWHKPDSKISKSSTRKVFHGEASPWHNENAHTYNSCLIKVLWAFSPHRGLASPWVTYCHTRYKVCGAWLIAMLILCGTPQMGDTLGRTVVVTRDGTGMLIAVFYTKASARHYRPCAILGNMIG